ncbi:peptidylprolyl isomerase [Streptomyces sp. RB6PN25]|uniref:Peptidyl-prolyl cis-trans isomerase n=1 Tax=Streptomyces humicola TaxID=2953240 RepID=A0ABT1PYQ9_9ACTN|nr:peptidylprolyl isomerase [Streptomyces humicola]MCQ4082764.1 peptidylprolyl isomerase [Streptomyces humicola]
MVSKEQRRRQLAREKYERQQQRRAQQRARARRRSIIAGAVVAVVVAAVAATYASVGLVGTKSSAAAASSTTPTAASPTSTAPDPCAKAAPGSPGTKQWKQPPAMTIDTKANYTMDLQTTCGDISLKLDAAAAPHTVNSFDFLAAQGFFDHTKCHRLTTQGIYVLQCGDPTGTGSGGPGYKLPDENLGAFGKKNAQDVVTYPAGTVAMANSGPNTGGSQFFLVYKDSPLAPSYTPFGTISPAGMKVLQKIAAAGESSGQGDGAPNATVVINKATVTRS